MKYSAAFLASLSRAIVYLLACVGVSSRGFAQHADRQWPFEVKVDVFKLHSDFELDDRQQLESILGDLREDVSSVLQLPSPEASIHIVLFSNSKEYTRYMQHYFPSIVQRRAIYLQDRGPGMLFTFWHDDIEIDLRHEAVHAILNQGGMQLPLWLDEGLAEYFEVPKTRRFANTTYAISVSERARGGLVPSLMQLEKLNNMVDFSEDNYRDSWAWIHFMLHRRQQTRQLLIDYVSRYRKQIPQPALSRQIAEITSDLSMEFTEHFAKVSSDPALITPLGRSSDSSRRSANGVLSNPIQ